MAKSHPYENPAQQRCLKIIMTLFGHEVDGLSPSQIAKLVNTTASNVTRDVYNLMEAGFVEHVPHNNNLRISTRLGQKAFQILNNLSVAQQRLDDIRNRYTRT